MRRQHAPEATFQETWHEVRGDYTATKQTALKRKREGLPYGGSDADWHIRRESDFLKLIELARDVDRNDMIVGQGIGRYVDQVLKGGIPVDPQTGDPDLDDMLEQDWLDWGSEARNCHSQGRCTWHQLERLALRQTLVDGDIFAVPVDDGTLETFEAHRARTPSNTRRKVVHGVLLDERDRPAEYWFTRAEVSPTAAVRKVGEVRAYPAYDSDGQPNVFHVIRRRRVSQTRGLSVMAPIMDPIGIHDDMQFAALVKRQVEACITFLRELPEKAGTGAIPSLEGANGVSPENGTAGETELRESEDGVERLLQHVYPGMELVGKRGEKLQAFAPNPGGDSFREHSVLVLSIIAVNLGVPVQVLLLDAMMSNLSTWRGIQDVARTSYCEAQSDLIDGLHRPTYRWRIRYLLSLGESDARGRMLRQALDAGKPIFRHIWTPPTWGYIDPLKDTTADLLQQDGLLNSRRRIQAAKGRNWFNVADEIVEDNAYAIRRSVLELRKLKEEFPEELQSLTWREVLQLTNVEKLRITITDSPASDQASGGNDGTAD